MNQQHEARRYGGKADEHPWQAVRFYGCVFFEMLAETRNAYKYTYGQSDKADGHVIFWTHARLAPKLPQSGAAL